MLADFRERRSDYSILIFLVNDGVFLLKSFKFGVPAVLYHQPTAVDVDNSFQPPGKRTWRGYKST